MSKPKESSDQFYLMDKDISKEIGHKIETQNLINKLLSAGIEVTEYAYRTDATDACVTIDEYYHVTIAKVQKMIMYELCYWNNLKTALHFCGTTVSIDNVISKYKSLTLKTTVLPRRTFVIKSLNKPKL